MTSTENATLNERLAKLETKLDLLLERLGPQHADHETRLRSLEQKVWTLAGLAASPGVVAFFAWLATR